MYTDAEKARLQTLTDAEAAIVDIAKFEQTAPSQGRNEQRTVVFALLRYALSEGFSEDCRKWLTEIISEL